VRITVRIDPEVGLGFVQQCSTMVQNQTFFSDLKLSLSYARLMNNSLSIVLRLASVWVSPLSQRTFPKQFRV